MPPLVRSLGPKILDENRDGRDFAEALNLDMDSVKLFHCASLINGDERSTELGIYHILMALVSESASVRPRIDHKRMQKAIKLAK